MRFLIWKRLRYKAERWGCLCLREKHKKGGENEEFIFSDYIVELTYKMSNPGVP